MPIHLRKVTCFTDSQTSTLVVSCIGTGSSLGGNSDIGILLSARGVVRDMEPAFSGNGFALISPGHCRVTEDSRIQHADDVSCVCSCVLEREPRTILWRVSLYIIQAST